MRTRSGGSAEHRGGVVAVHERRLGAGADHQRLALEPGRAGLGLDVGVLDEAGRGGLERHACADAGERRRGVAAADPALDQPVAGAVGGG